MTRGVRLSGLAAALFAIGTFALSALAPAAARAETPVLRVAVLKFGTVNWLMETVTAEGLDAANGFRLETLPLAGDAATSVAFQSGEAEMMVTDWVWAMRKRADGLAIRWTPYSRALGALMTRGDVADICALKGKRVGVVGGDLDKSWLIFQALARKQCGFDLAAEVETLHGAPPLMSRQLTEGAVDAVSNYWHFVARLKAEGAKTLVTVDDALAALGVAPAPALVGFVWEEGAVDPKLAAAFETAIRAAGAVLVESDAAWERIRPLMRADDDAAFLALRDDYRAGVPGAWTEADTAAARGLYDILTTQGGAAFAATAGPFEPAVFDPPGAGAAAD